MPTWVAGRAGQNGFTLLELLIALTIMVALIGLVPVAFDRMVPKQRLRAETYAVAQELRKLRARVQSEGHISVVEPGTDPDVLMLGARRHRVTDGIRIRAPKQILFFPDGSTSGGVVMLDSPAGAWNIRIGIVSGALQMERT